MAIRDPSPWDGDFDQRNTDRVPGKSVQIRYFFAADKSLPFFLLALAQPHARPAAVLVDATIDLGSFCQITIYRGSRN